MNKKIVKTKNQNVACGQKAKNGIKTISYRLKCKKTANGLSHYVMYGDIDKNKALL